MCIPSSQADGLHRSGCDTGSGRLYSRPVRPGENTVLLPERPVDTGAGA